MVEFGAGASTNLFALLGANKVCSFEQSEKYYDNLHRNLPGCVSLFLCPLKYEYLEGCRVISYEKEETQMPPEIDLLYIDGPGPVDGEYSASYPIISGDIFEMVRKGIKPKMIVCDGRWFNMYLFNKLLRPYYRIKPNICWKCTELYLR